MEAKPRLRTSFWGFLLCLAVALVAAPARAGGTPLSQFELLGHHATPTGINDVRVRGGLAYTAHYVDPTTSVVQILDVSDPAGVAEVGSLTLTHPYNDYSLPFAIALVQDRAYVSMYYGGFAIVDVADPLRPRLLGAFDPNGGHGDSLQGIVVDGDYLYAGWDYRHGLGIFDVGDPASPALVAQAGGIGYARMVLKKQNYVFVSTYYNGAIRIYDVSDPAAPEMVNSIATPGYSYYIGDIAGDYFFLADRSATYGLRVYDVADPANPVQVGQVDTASLGFGDVGDAKVHGGELFVTFAGHVAVFDVREPANPILTSTLDVPAGNGALFDFADGRLYLPGQDGLSIYGQPSLSCFSTQRFRYEEIGRKPGLHLSKLSVRGRYSPSSWSDLGDPMNYGALVRQNGLSLAVPSGAWQQDEDRYSYQHSDASSAWTFEIVPSTGMWWLEYAQNQWGAIDPASGVTSALTLGNQVGSSSFVPEHRTHGKHGEVWTYHAAGPPACLPDLPETPEDIEP